MSTITPGHFTNTPEEAREQEIKHILSLIDQKYVFDRLDIRDITQWQKQGFVPMCDVEIPFDRFIERVDEVRSLYRPGHSKTDESIWSTSGKHLKAAEPNIQNVPRPKKKHPAFNPKKLEGGYR